ncbi:MAG: cache domain-containing protein [Anaerolineae bacterium]
MRRRIRPGLRARIIAWAFVPTLVVLGAVAAFTFYTYGRVTETLVLERNRKLTELLAQQMAVEFTGYVDVLNALAMTPDLQSMEPAHLQTALRWSVGTLRDFDGGVVVLDSAGRVVAADRRRPELVGQDWSQRGLFTRLATDDAVNFLSDVEPLDPDGRPAIAIVLPVGGLPRQPVGVLVGLFELDTPLRRASALYDSMRRFQTRPDESRLYLVDSAGRLIDPSRTLAPGQDVSAWPAVIAAQSGSGALRTTGLGGEDVIASYAPVPDTPWTLIEEESWAALTAASRGYGRLLLGLLVLGLVLSPVLLAVGLRRIVRPVAEMTAAAQRIASGSAMPFAGDLAQRIDAPSDDELGDLATAFNEMSGRLQVLYGSLERQVAERTHELATLNGVTRAVNASLDLRQTLSVALEQTLAALGASAGLIYSARPGRERLEVVARGLDGALEGEIRAGLEHGDLVMPPVDVVTAALEAQGETVGAIWVWPAQDAPVSEETTALLRAIGQGVGVAAENARLYAEVEREAVVSERNRIARELHDSVTQTLFSANLIAGVLPLLWERDPAVGQQRLAELRELTQGALAEMRMLLLELRPTALNAADLGDLLSQLRDAVAARARLPVSLEISGTARVPAPVRLALYRVAQEALNNAVKHAGASALAITLASDEGRVHLEVIDNGCGFDPTQAQADRLGLTSMRERMAAAGGRLDIESRPGAGTRIVAEWAAPVEAGQKEE